MSDKSNSQERRPEESAFKQQRLKAWKPVLTPKWVVSSFAVIGVLFIIIGIAAKVSSDAVTEYKIQYDGDSSDPCTITSYKQGRECSLTFNIDKDMDGPVYLYYQLTNFYQNHRRYVSSRYDAQLQGSTLHADTDYCSPLTSNGSQDLNPCGLVANSLFNDVIALEASTNAAVALDEAGITWDSDRATKFAQPDGFAYVTLGDDAGCTELPCTCETAFDSSDYDDCEFYTDAENTTYAYYYPENDEIQYLYETFPEVINPIEGVTNEHFIVWMRTAALPKFRKLYGIIDTDLKEGDEITFKVTANYLVSSFDGTKSIILANASWFGGKNAVLGMVYIVAGVVSLSLAIAFGIKQKLQPRALANPAELLWKQD
mmetsp:Transcript_17860/g.28154  ORF Transcript_17860/g.28154 Transcript_17860/m.28154 type:complete len:372 (+) Transcript_17860:58-1173(+)